MNHMEFSHLQRELRSFADNPDALLPQFLLSVNTHDLLPCLWLMQDPFLNRAVAKALSPRAAAMILEDVANYNQGRAPAQCTDNDYDVALSSARTVVGIIQRLQASSRKSV